MAESKRAGRPRGDRDDVPVKLDRKLVDQARVVAAFKRTTLVELLSDMLKAPVDRAHTQMVKELSRKEGRTVGMTREEIAAEKAREREADFAADAAKDQADEEARLAAEEKQLRDALDNKHGKKKGGAK